MTTTWSAPPTRRESWAGRADVVDEAVDAPPGTRPVSPPGTRPVSPPGTRPVSTPGMRPVSPPRVKSDHHSLTLSTTRGPSDPDDDDDAAPSTSGPRWPARCNRDAARDGPMAAAARRADGMRALRRAARAAEDAELVALRARADAARRRRDAAVEASRRARSDPDTACAECGRARAARRVALLGTPAERKRKRGDASPPRRCPTHTALAMDREAKARVRDPASRPPGWPTWSGGWDDERAGRRERVGEGPGPSNLAARTMTRDAAVAARRAALLSAKDARDEADRAASLARAHRKATAARMADARGPGRGPTLVAFGAGTSRGAPNDFLAPGRADAAERAADAAGRRRSRAPTGSAGEPRAPGNGGASRRWHRTGPAEPWTTELGAETWGDVDGGGPAAPPTAARPATPTHPTLRTAPRQGAQPTVLGPPSSLLAWASSGGGADPLASGPRALDGDPVAALQRSWGGRGGGGEALGPPAFLPPDSDGRWRCGAAPSAPAAADPNPWRLTPTERLAATRAARVLATAADEIEALDREAARLRAAQRRARVAAEAAARRTAAADERLRERHLAARRRAAELDEAGEGRPRGARPTTAKATTLETTTTRPPGRVERRGLGGGAWIRPPEVELEEQSTARRPFRARPAPPRRQPAAADAIPRPRDPPPPRPGLAAAPRAAAALLADLADDPPWLAAAAASARGVDAVRAVELTRRALRAAAQVG